jgi:hypothetical protein
MVLGGRQAVTLLHTASWWTGSLFLVLSFILSLLTSRSNIGASEVQQRLRTQPAPVAPPPLEQVTPIPPPAATPSPTPPPATTR